MKNTKPVRIDADFEQKMRDIMGERLNRKLCQPTLQSIGLPEATRLVLRCPSWPNVERELRTIPKRKR